MEVSDGGNFTQRKRVRWIGNTSLMDDLDPHKKKQGMSKALGYCRGNFDLGVIMRYLLEYAKHFSCKMALPAGLTFASPS